MVVCSCILILYGGLNAWPIINTEIPGITLFLGVGDASEHGISLQDFKHHTIFRNRVGFREYMVLERQNTIQYKMVA